MSRITITEEDIRAAGPPRLSDRHPLLSYVFGDMARGFYIVGCLALDLLGPLQVRESVPALSGIAFVPVVAAIGGLVYGQYRLYCRLWPIASRRRILEVVDRETH
ncbi:MAG TPA: hypothetical protein VEO96_03330 [Thermoplasmata archaeon]|nr:hypothetical protein [Thermoplasmata archaeon]